MVQEHPIISRENGLAIVGRETSRKRKFAGSIGKHCKLCGRDLLIYQWVEYPDLCPCLQGLSGKNPHTMNIASGDVSSDDQHVVLQHHFLSGTFAKVAKTFGMALVSASFIMA